MPDHMRKKVAVAILKGGSFNPDKDEMRWARLSARAALDACHFEELVAALRPFAEYGEHMHRLHDSMVITQGSGMARRQLTGGDCKAAFALLAKVEASDA